MIANFTCILAGLVLIWLVLIAAEARDASVRMVSRSAWGGVIYAIGTTLVVVGVLA